MNCQKLKQLFKDAKFQSLFNELNALDLGHEPELEQLRDRLSASFRRYQRERSLMDTRDYETAQHQLSAQLHLLLDDLCSGEPSRAETDNLLALIEQNQYNQVFTQIKASGKSYDKSILSRLERQFSFQVTLDLIDQLKVFVGSLR
ncbi:MAG: hypothetical protein ACFCUI_05100 [Bernardetiaceae bacterium]